jgi:hypothetical protein
MGQSIQIADATFTKVIASLALPDRSSLVAEYLFGTDFATSSRNLANASMPLLAVGAPIYGVNFARVQSGASGFGFNTQITPLTDCTMIDIRGPISLPSASTYMIAAGSMGMYVRTNNHFFKGGTYGSLDAGAVNNSGASTWNFSAGVSDAGSGLAKHYRGDSSTGVLNEATAANARTGTSTGIAYLGTSACSGTVAGVQHSHAYLAIFNRILTTVQLEAVYQSMRPFMALRGISI